MEATGERPGDRHIDLTATTSRLQGLSVVFSTAFALIFLESILYSALLFVASYIEATMAIPIALIGIAVGGLAVYLVKDRVRFSLTLLNLLVCALLLSLPFTYAVVAAASSRILAFSWLLLFPFVFGSMILSFYFVYTPSDRAYFADLVGAGLGAAAAALAIEYVGAESALFLSGLLLALSAILCSVSADRRLRFDSALVLLLSLLLLGTVAYNARTDALNWARTAVPHGASSAGRTYTGVRNRRELVYSHTSASGRTDAVVLRDKKGKITSFSVYHNGLMSDGLKFKDVPGYALDPRVPWGLVEDPDSLIIGTSAEGVVSAVKGMGKGRVDGVEICTGKVDLMTRGPAKKLTYDAYSHLDRLEILDARSYIDNYRLSYDHYALMNAHLGQRALRASAPEYLHTVEAVVSYLTHLTDRGFINIEELARPETMDVDINVKFVATVIEALRRIGVSDPGPHLFIYRWGSYIQFFIKKVPFSAGELHWLDRWLDRQVKNTRPLPFIVVPNIAWHPRKEVRGAIAAMIRTRGAFTKQDRDYSFVTDDRPFALDIDPDRPALRKAFYFVLLLALGLILVPVIAILARRRSKLGISPAVAMYLYFGVLGIAYLLIEVMLIQKYQMYVGSPVGSAIAVLGGMLVASGLGSFCSSRFSRSRIGPALAFALIIATSLAMLAWLPSVLQVLASTHLWLRMIIAVATLAPLAFFMGMPFPMALSAVKRQADARYAALMFAVNGACSAIATPVSMMLSMNWGYRVTLMIGVALYALLFFLFAAIARREPVAAG